MVYQDNPCLRDCQRVQLVYQGGQIYHYHGFQPVNRADRSADVLKGPRTFGERLRDAVDRWGSIRQFADVLKERGLSGKGATRTMIHRYLNDESVPPLEFIRMAATVLGVREEWLETGEGARTTAGERAREATQEGSETEAWDIVREELFWLKSVDVAAHATLMSFLARNHETAHRLGVEGLDLRHLWKLADEIVWAPIMYWTDLLGKDIPVDPDEMSTYAVAVFNALTQAVSVAVPPGMTRQQLDELEDLAPSEDPDQSEASGSDTPA